MVAEHGLKGEEPSEFLKMTELRYGHIPDFKNAKIPLWTEASMTPELLEEWWQSSRRGNSKFRRLSHLKQCGRRAYGALR